MFMRGLSPFHPLIPHPERTMGKEGSKGIFSSQARREIPGEDLPPLRPSAKTVCLPLAWPGHLPSARVGSHGACHLSGLRHCLIHKLCLDGPCSWAGRLRPSSPHLHTHPALHITPPCRPWSTAGAWTSWCVMLQSTPWWGACWGPVSRCGTR